MYELRAPTESPGYEDLAVRFGVSRDTVKNWLARCREALLLAAREVLAQAALAPDEIEPVPDVPVQPSRNEES